MLALFVSLAGILVVDAFPALGVDQIVPETRVAPVVALWGGKGKDPRLATQFCPTYSEAVIKDRRVTEVIPTTEAANAWNSAKRVYELESGKSNPKSNWGPLGGSNKLQPTLKKIDTACKNKDLPALRSQLLAFRRASDAWFRCRTPEDSQDVHIKKMQAVLEDIGQKLLAFTGRLEAILQNPLPERQILPTPPLLHLISIQPEHLWTESVFTTVVEGRIFKMNIFKADPCAHTWFPARTEFARKGIMESGEDLNSLGCWWYPERPGESALTEMKEHIFLTVAQMLRAEAASKVDKLHFLIEKEFQRDNGKMLRSCWSRLSPDPEAWGISRALSQNAKSLWSTEFGTFIAENLLRNYGFEESSSQWKPQLMHILGERQIATDLTKWFKTHGARFPDDDTSTCPTL